MMKKNGYPKIHLRYALTPKGNLYDVDKEAQPVLLASDIADFDYRIYEYFIFLTRSGEIKFQGEHRLVDMFAGFSDGKELYTETYAHRYWVRDSKGQWYGFGNNEDGEIQPLERKVVHTFPEEEYYISYSGDQYEHTGRYYNFKRVYPEGIIKRTSKYEELVEKYGEENVKIVFHSGPEEDFLEVLNASSYPTYNKANIPQKESYKVDLVVENQWIFEPVPVDGPKGKPTKNECCIDEKSGEIKPKVMDEVGTVHRLGRKQYVMLCVTEEGKLTFWKGRTETSMSYVKDIMDDVVFIRCVGPHTTVVMRDGVILSLDTNTLYKGGIHAVGRGE